MKTSALLLAPILFAWGAFADSCNGDIFNNYCCVNGQFSGVRHSFIYSYFAFASPLRSASISYSFLNKIRKYIYFLPLRHQKKLTPSQPVVQSLNSNLSNMQSSLSQIAPNIQKSLSSELAGIPTPTITKRAELAKRTITSEVSPGLTCIGDSVSSSGSGSKNFAPVVTQAPVWIAGAAAVMGAAYGAM